MWCLFRNRPTNVVAPILCLLLKSTLLQRGTTSNCWYILETRQMLESIKRVVSGLQPCKSGCPSVLRCPTKEAPPIKPMGLVNTYCFSKMIHNMYFWMLMTPYNKATNAKFTLPGRHDKKCVPENYLYL